MQGILELGLSPERRGGPPANPLLAPRGGRKLPGAPARPLPVVGIGEATIRPFQSYAVQCPSGNGHSAMGKASHVFVELPAAGPGQGVVAMLRPASPHALDDTIEWTAHCYASGVGRTFDPETRLSYYSRARRIRPSPAMRAQFDWQQARVILMELISYVQEREAHLQSNPRDIDALTLFPRIDARRLALVASAARLRNVEAFIDLTLALFPGEAYTVSEHSYPFGNDRQLLAKLQSIVSKNTCRFAAFRGDPAAVLEPDGEASHALGGQRRSTQYFSETEQYLKRIDDSSMTEETKDVARRELERGSTEYVDTLLSLPWGKRSEVRINLSDAQRQLDADHYGLSGAKRCIVEFLAVQALSDRPPAQVLCLVGPPGCGKTSLGRAIARATNREYGRLSVGGMRDELQFLGSKRDYRNAGHGEIIETLRRLQVSNPVLLLDEVDKIGATDQCDPSAALLELLDTEHNHAFRDHYLNVPFDLSNVLFICTANCIDRISPPLRDRMEIIQIEPYNEQEKIHIAREHILPRQIERAGLTAYLENGQVEIATDALKALVSEFPHEGGVRNLARRVQSLCRQIAYRAVVAEEQQRRFKLRIAKENIPQFVPRAAMAPKLIGFDRARK